MLSVPSRTASGSRSATQCEATVFLFTRKPCENLDGDTDDESEDMIAPKRGCRSTATDVAWDILCASSATALPLFAGVGSLSGAAFIGSASGISMACLPLVVPPSLQAPPIATSSIPSYPDVNFWYQNLLASTVAQGFCGACEFFIFGDLVGGFMDMVMGGLGYYACGDDGSRFLPMYVVFSGFNGIIAALTLIGKVDQMAGPLFSARAPLIANLAHFVMLAKPALLLATCYCGYRYIKQLREVFDRGMGGSADDNSGSMFSGLVPSAGDAGDGAGGRRNTFNAFAGSGHRLGGDEESPRPKLNA